MGKSIFLVILVLDLHHSRKGAIMQETLWLVNDNLLNKLTFYIIYFYISFELFSSISLESLLFAFTRILLLDFRIIH